MRIPKKVVCELSDGDTYICEIDNEGWGRCGDAVVHNDGELCIWAEKVLEWQEEPMGV